MIEIGYSLSCEEHPPTDLVRYAQQAEDAGFAYAMISDHYHPWIASQGQSAFVWNVLGAIAQATTQLRLGTGVTCPLIRYHPAIIAQAAATVAAMMPGRFTLGVGTGENLNEHIVGQRWPSQAIRLAMLEEAITLMRLLWQGGTQNFHGRFYTVEQARLYTLPDQAPPIVVAAAGPRAAAAAGRLGDGLINYAAEKSVVETFNANGGAGKPRYAQVNICWASNLAEARRTAHKICPNVALKGQLGQELATPKMFEQAVGMVSEDQVAEVITCGPDPEQHIAAIQKFVDAGYDHLHIYQVGPDQAGFFRFYQREILPHFHMIAAQKAQERAV
jgi:coenzyme F420-dependent glucose-6-phosphate dehydrogenase